MTESRRIVKTRNQKLVVFSFAGLAVSLLVTGGLSASITCDRWVARMVSTQGHVEVSRAGQTQWQRATLNDTYCAGDRVQVGERSRADIALVNRPIIRLEQNTTITLAGRPGGKTLGHTIAARRALFLQPSIGPSGSVYAVCQRRRRRHRRAWSKSNPIAL